MNNVDIVRRSYDAFARHDLDGVMGDMHPEIVWDQALDEEWWNGFTAGPEEFLEAGIRWSWWADIEPRRKELANN